MIIFYKQTMESFAPIIETIEDEVVVVVVAVVVLVVDVVVTEVV